MSSRAEPGKKFRSRSCPKLDGSEALGAVVFESVWCEKTGAGELEYQINADRAMDPHSFFANPDLAVFPNCGSGSRCCFNSDPDPAEKTKQWSLCNLI